MYNWQRTINEEVERELEEYLNMKTVFTYCEDTLLPELHAHVLVRVDQETGEVIMHLISFGEPVAFIRGSVCFDYWRKDKKVPSTVIWHIKYFAQKYHATETKTWLPI